MGKAERLRKAQREGGLQAIGTQPAIELLSPLERRSLAAERIRSVTLGAYDWICVSDTLNDALGRILGGRKEEVEYGEAVIGEFEDYLKGKQYVLKFLTPDQNPNLIARARGSFAAFIANSRRLESRGYTVPLSLEDFAGTASACLATSKTGTAPISALVYDTADVGSSPEKNQYFKVLSKILELSYSSRAATGQQVHHLKIAETTFRYLIDLLTIGDTPYTDYLTHPVGGTSLLQIYEKNHTEDITSSTESFKSILKFISEMPKGDVAWQRVIEALFLSSKADVNTGINSKFYENEAFSLFTMQFKARLASEFFDFLGNTGERECDSEIESFLNNLDSHNIVRVAEVALNYIRSGGALLSTIIEAPYGQELQNILRNIRSNLRGSLKSDIILSPIGCQELLAAALPEDLEQLRDVWAKRFPGFTNMDFFWRNISGFLQALKGAKHLEGAIGEITKEKGRGFIQEILANEGLIMEVSRYLSEQIRDVNDEKLEELRLSLGVETKNETAINRMGIIYLRFFKTEDKDIFDFACHSLRSGVGTVGEIRKGGEFRLLSGKVANDQTRALELFLTLIADSALVEVFEMLQIIPRDEERSYRLRRYLNGSSTFDFKQLRKIYDGGTEENDDNPDTDKTSKSARESITKQANREMAELLRMIKEGGVGNGS